jgi:hypothetical protein
VGHSGHLPGNAAATYFLRASIEPGLLAVPVVTTGAVGRDLRYNGGRRQSEDYYPLAKLKCRLGTGKGE